MRRSYFALTVLPTWSIFALLFLLVWPLRLACEHLVILALLGTILVTLCSSGSQKIPFACSYLPGKGNLHFVFWACASLLVPLVLAGARAEMQLLDHPFRYSVIVVALLLSLIASLRWSRRSAKKFAPGPRLLFEDTRPAETLSLNLAGE